LIEIRPEQKKDLEAIRNVNTLAFQGTNEAKLVDSIRDSEHFIPELSLVAVANEVVGHILFSTVSIETNEGPVKTLALSPMSVLPGCQKQGIGSQLVKAGIKQAEKLGLEHIVVLGHPDFYPKFGFVPSTTKGIESPIPVPEEVFMVLEIKSGSLNKVKGKVKYPPAFDVVS
jgi:putative acetyltransferase